jgi:hypothetical protein
MYASSHELIIHRVVPPSHQHTLYRGGDAMSVKVRFVINHSLGQFSFTEWNQLDQDQAEIIRDRWTTWEKQVKESAASFLLKETLSQQTASHYKIRYTQTKRSPSN